MALDLPNTIVLTEGLEKAVMVAVAIFQDTILPTAGC